MVTAVRRVLHTGRVSHDDGRPAGGALVWVSSGTAPTPEIAVVCDDDGQFRLSLPPGQFVIQARSSDGMEGRIDEDLSAEPAQLEIRLDEGVQK